MKPSIALICIFFPAVFGGSIQNVDYEQNRHLIGSMDENPRAARFFGGVVYRSTTRMTHYETMTITDASLCAAKNYECKRRRKRSAVKVPAPAIVAGEEAPVLKTLDARVARVLKQKAEELELNLHDIEAAQFIKHVEPEEERQDRDFEELPVVKENQGDQVEIESNRKAKIFANRITVVGTVWVTYTTTTTTTLGTLAITGAAGQCPGASITDHYPLCP